MAKETLDGVPEDEIKRRIEQANEEFNERLREQVVDI